MTSTKTKPPASDARAPQIVNSNGTASVHLTLAVCDYEHVREITQGLVRADGITLTPLILPSIEEITFRFTKSLEWDVSELSFGKYISLTSQGDAPMIAIPVFPSRVHRHSAIYVRADRGIGELSVDRRLQRAAALQARDMVRRSYFSHVTPEGAKLSARLREW